MRISYNILENEVHTELKHVFPYDLSRVALNIDG